MRSNVLNNFGEQITDVVYTRGNTLVESIGKTENPKALTAETLADYAEDIQTVINEAFSEAKSEEGISAFAADILSEDATMAAQVFVNSVSEMRDISVKNENVTALGQSVVAATMTTVLKQPMDTTAHRALLSKAASSPVFEVVEILPTVKFYGSSKEEAIYDALERGKNAADQLELIPTVLKTPIALTNDKVTNINLVDSLNENYDMNRDLKLVGIAVTIDTNKDGETTPNKAALVQLRVGSRPYYDSKTKTLTATYEIYDPADVNKETVLAEIHIDSNLEDSGNVIKNITATPYAIDDTHSYITDSVTMYGTLSHAEHLHPSRLGIKSRREEYSIPTRPHYEIAISKEEKMDLEKSNTGIKGDIMTMLGSEAVKVANHVEEMRILNTLGLDVAVEGDWVTAIAAKANGELHVDIDFELPAGYAGEIFQYVQTVTVPSLDLIITELKNKYHLADSHARILISPMLAKHATPQDIRTTKGTVENGPAVMAQELSAISSTNTMIFVPDERVSTWQLKLLMIPNKKDRVERRTYEYHRYASYMTTDLRKSSNPIHGATTYCLRNKEFVAAAIGANINPKNYIGTANSKVLVFK